MRILSPKKTESYAITPDLSVTLAQLFNLGPERSDQSGFLALHNNDESLAWRIALIEKAEKTIDAQYYSWHTDTSGALLLSKIIEAADRGVRVRLLLDDIDTFGADRQIATLNRHANIEVRIFNPFKLRWPIRLVRIIELLWNLDRLTRRMHNKLLVADNVISIIGGRNIGDEYFGLSTKLAFRDLDLLACGASVEELSNSFDLFWNNDISKPARKLIAFRPKGLDFRHMKKRLDKKTLLTRQIIQRIDNLKAGLLKKSDLATSLIKSDSLVFYDLPEPEHTEMGQMARSLYQCSENTSKQLIIISAYFVPSNNLIQSLQALIQRGVHIQVFTNSLASIDVTAAFCGYQRYRIQLLSMGIELFEFCARPKYHSIYTTPSVNVKRFSLHAKSIIYDSSSVYVGTLNLDPRSSSLNTEIGMLVKSKALAEEIQQAFFEDLSEGEFWKVSLNHRGKTTWINGNTKTNIQPARNLLQRLLNFIYSLLPIHQQL